MSVNHKWPNSELFTPEYFTEDVCRLCWNKEVEETPSKILIKRNEMKNQLAQKILECLDIDLTLPPYPNNVCNSCSAKVDEFHTFYKFCKEKEKQLREILNTTTEQDYMEVEEPFDVKVEKYDSFPDLDFSKTDTLNSLLDSLEQSNSSDVELICDLDTSKSNKKKYELKRNPTYCNICQVDFENIDNFTKHNSARHGIENTGSVELFKCFGCEKRFKTRKSRLGHEINFCRGLKDGYKCPVCDRFLPKRRMYESHMRDHRENNVIELPEEIFKCSKCLKVFPTRGKLLKHKVVHDNGKNFICETCGRVFTRQDYLRKHTLTHTGVKHHACQRCNYRTSQKSSLNVHMRKHTGERPFSCDVCPQRCISSSNLRAHRLRHLGDKKFQCAICSKKFGYKISLEEHISSTHERSQLHLCPLCGAQYTRVRGLRRHLAAKHGQQSKEVKNNEKSSEQDYLKIVTDNEKMDDDYGLKDGECLDVDGKVSFNLRILE